jgi:DNA-binding GntR family transcriptional regulator
VQYQRIRDEVLDGTFSPGTLLLETMLSRRYNISRTPVREALGLLAQDGLLERTRRGFVVRTRTAEEILDLFDARIALESTAAGLAAERRSELELLRLEELIERRRQATDEDAIAQADRQWHLALRLAAHNQTITSLLNQVATQLSIYRPAFTMRTGANSELDEHYRVTEAIRKQDREAARLAMIAHLEVGRQLSVRALLEDLG